MCTAASTRQLRKNINSSQVALQFVRHLLGNGGGVGFLQGAGSRDSRRGGRLPSWRLSFMMISAQARRPPAHAWHHRQLPWACMSWFAPAPGPSWVCSGYARVSSGCHRYLQVDALARGCNGALHRGSGLPAKPAAIPTASATRTAPSSGPGQQTPLEDRPRGSRSRACGSCGGRVRTGSNVS